MQLARSITFTHGQRVDPRQGWRPESLDVTDGNFADGVKGEDNYKTGRIEVYLGDGPDGGSRYVRVWNPRTDQQTGKPMQVLVPLERVVAWEPLHEDMAAALYPHGDESRPAPKKARRMRETAPVVDEIPDLSGAPLA
jgi:hypothetical protein